MIHILIIEGPDAAGKTTLAVQLNERYGFPVIKRGSHDPFLWALTEMTSWEGRPLQIYDRFPLVSEYIYGPIRRGGISQPFDPRYTPCVLLLSRLIQDTLVIYCRPPKELIIAESKKTGQPTDIQENITEIVEAYDRHFTEIPHRLYDYTEDRPQDLTSIIEEHKVAWERL